MIIVLDTILDSLFFSLITLFLALMSFGPRQHYEGETKMRNAFRFFLMIWAYIVYKAIRHLPTFEIYRGLLEP